MRHFSIQNAAKIAATLLFAWGPVSARASLGDSVSQGDLQTASANSGVAKALVQRKLSKSGATTFSVRETSDKGTTLREYISSSGVIFGIAWNGISHPDIDSLLGSYASQYHEADEASPRARGIRARHLDSGDLIYATTGNMRALRGVVYSKKLLPSGVDPHEIK